MTNAANTTLLPTLLPTSTRAAAEWRAGDNAGAGFPVGDGATYEEQLASAVCCGWAVLCERRSPSDVVIMQAPDGRLVAVGDVHGAWGVYL